MPIRSRRGRRGLPLALLRRCRSVYRKLLGALSVGLESRLDDCVSPLSGGERQALTVRMATLVRPEILLDEHTAASIRAARGSAT